MENFNNTAEKRKVTRVAVLFGGRSSEHEISILSSLELMDAFDSRFLEVIPVYVSIDGRWYIGQHLRNRNKYKDVQSLLESCCEVTLLPKPATKGLSVLGDPQFVGHDLTDDDILPVDVFFPLFHGQFGEDGCIQGLFELAEVAYVGCGVMSSAVAMNKYVCKSFLAQHGIPVLPSMIVRKVDALRNFEGVLESVLRNESLCGFPLFIKPNCMGSSVGIGKAHDLDELKTCLATVFRFDSTAIVEKCVSNLFEINVAVRNFLSPQSSVVEVPAKSGDLLTYEDKYMSGSKKGGRPSRGMASLVRAIDPDDLPPDYKRKVQGYAIDAYRLLECAGIARLDFIVDKSEGEVYFNEINTPPGSLAHYLWAKSEPQQLYTEVINDLVLEAETVLAIKLGLLREFGFKALKG